MRETTLTQTRIRGGVWQGVLTGPAEAPALEVMLLDVPLPGLTVTQLTDSQNSWAVRISIPSEVLSEGVQTFLIRETGRSETLARFTIITGVAMADDMRAEIDLLRAELDMLKRAFRRHCVATPE